MNKKIYVVVLFSISCNFTFPIRLPVYVEFIRKNVKLHKMKNEKNSVLLRSKFWSILPENFVRRKPFFLKSEECLTKYGAGSRVDSNC